MIITATAQRGSTVRPGRRRAVPGSRRRALTFVSSAVIGVLTVVSLSACGNDGPSTGSGPANRPGAAPAITTPAPAPVEASNLNLPRTVPYSGVEYTITKVTLHATDPLYRLRPEDTSSPLAQTRGVLVAMTATNTNRVEVTLPKAILITGTETQGAAVEPEQRGQYQVPGGVTTEVRAFFRTDLADVSASTFSISEQGRVPASTPLTGPTPPTGFPVAGTAGAMGPVGVSNGSDTLKVVVKRAQLNLESLPAGAERAEIGRRFIVLSGTVAVARSPLGSPGYFTYETDIRVLADDLAVSPSSCQGDRYETSLLLQPGEVKEFVCAFPVKDSATTFAVSSGYAASRYGPVATAPITLSGPVPPAPAP